jgi:hypothetical protein
MFLFLFASISPPVLVLDRTEPSRVDPRSEQLYVYDATTAHTMSILEELEYVRL